MIVFPVLVLAKLSLAHLSESLMVCGVRRKGLQVAGFDFSLTTFNPVTVEEVSEEIRVRQPDAEGWSKLFSILSSSILGYGRFILGATRLVTAKRGAPWIAVDQIGNVRYRGLELRISEQGLKRLAKYVEL